MAASSRKSWCRRAIRSPPAKILVRLDHEDLQAELTIVENQLFEILARRGRLSAERDGAAQITFDPLLLEVDSPVVAELMEGQQRLFEARAEIGSPASANS